MLSSASRTLAYKSACGLMMAIAILNLLIQKLRQRPTSRACKRVEGASFVLISDPSVTVSVTLSGFSYIIPDPETASWSPNSLEDINDTKPQFCHFSHCKARQRTLINPTDTMDEPKPFSEPPWLLNHPSPYYTESHRTWQRFCREFLDEHFTPHALQWERDGEVPLHVYGTYT